VVHTIGFNDGLWIDRGGSPLTDAAKLTERFKRINYGKLEIEVTVDDPESLHGAVDHHARLHHRARHRSTRIPLFGKRARQFPSGREVALQARQFRREEHRHPAAAVVAAEDGGAAKVISSVKPRVPVLSQTSTSRPSAPVRARMAFHAFCTSGLVRRADRSTRGGLPRSIAVAIMAVAEYSG
jgi:hypothetical protein